MVYDRQTWAKYSPADVRYLCLCWESDRKKPPKVSPCSFSLFLFLYLMCFRPFSCICALVNIFIINHINYSNTVLLSHLSEIPRCGKNSACFIFGIFFVPYRCHWLYTHIAFVLGQNCPYYFITRKTCAIEEASSMASPFHCTMLNVLGVNY